MVLGIIMPFLIEPFLSRLFYEKGESFIIFYTASRFIIWATLGLLYLYTRHGEVQPFILWSKRDYDWKFYLAWTAGLFLLYIAAIFISSIPYRLGLRQHSTELARVHQLFRQYPGLAWFTALTAGVTEELFFRGYIMSRLAVFFKNRHYVVLISAILFCAIHIGYHSWSEIIFTFAIGLIFGYHYYKYRNLKILIAMHFIIDVIAVILVTAIT
jgi:hypothetical protein